MNRFDGSPPWHVEANEARVAVAHAQDLHYYVRVLARYWWVLAGSMLIGAILAVLYVTSVEPVYRASASLLIEPQQSNVVSIDELIGVATEAPDYYETQFAMLRARALARRVIMALDLWDHPELAVSSDDAPRGMLDRLRAGVAELGWSFGAVVSKDSAPVEKGDDQAEAERTRVATNARERVVSQFLARLSISPLPETKIVRIRYESGDPELAARVANAVGEQYITGYLDTKLTRTERAATWLGERVTELQSTLRESEQRLLKFKRDNDLVDVDGNIGRLGEQELLMATTELATAQRNFTEQRELRRRIRSFGDDVDLLMSIGRIQQDPLVQRARIEEEMVRQEMQKLRTRYGPRHPNVLDAQSRLDTIMAGMRQQVNRVVGIVETEFTAARQRLADIETQLQIGKREVQTLGEQRLELDALEREVATNLQIYQTFYNRMTEVRSADGLDSANASLSDHAVPPEVPISPQPVLAFGVALFLSLFLAGIAVVAREQLDRSINEPADVERALGYSVLGVLPRVTGRRLGHRRDGPLKPENVQDGVFVETVNAIRTTLDLTSGPGQRNRVLLVTSSVPGEGKSSLSMNLAHSFGRRERVLLIDADMRRPSLSVSHSRRGNAAASAPGLSELAAGDATAVQTILRDGAGPGVDLLPAGAIPKHPLELLSSDRVDEILTALAKHYDRIVVDSPPVRAVADALVLAKHSDAVLYVVKAHDTSIDVVQRGLQRFESIGIDVAGVVITQIDSRKTRSYESDRYYSSYHDLRGGPDERPPSWMHAKRRAHHVQPDGIRHPPPVVDLPAKGNIDKVEVARPSSTNGISPGSMNDII